jgi:hypothetical protein
VLHPVAQILEEVIETFTGSPPDRLLRVLPDQNAVSRRDPAGREIDKVAYPRIDDAPSTPLWPFAVFRCDSSAVGLPAVPRDTRVDQLIGISGPGDHGVDGQHSCKASKKIEHAVSMISAVTLSGGNIRTTQSLRPPSSRINPRRNAAA